MNILQLIQQLTGSIKAKLFFCFAIIAIIVTLAGFSSMLPFIRLEKSMRRIGNDNLQSLLCIDAIKDAQSQILTAERTLLIRQLADQEVRTEMYQIIEQAYTDARKAAEEFNTLSLDPELLSSWRAFREVWATWRAKQQELLDILHKQEELLRQGIRGGRQFDRIANQAFDLAFSEVHEYRVQTRVHLNELANQIRNDTVSAIDDTLHTANVYFRWLVVFLITAFILSILLGMWLSGRITKPILEGVNHITRIADGNLSHDVKPQLMAQSGETGLLLNAVQRLIESHRKEVNLFKAIADGDYTSTLEPRSGQDELGQAMDQMVKTNNKALNQVNVAVDQVTYRANAINNASQTLSQGALETASSLQEISATMSQISEKTRANAASAEAADQLADASRAAVDKGYEAVAELTTAMKDLQTTNAQIASVVKLIDDIAFQTNLLALNAAVEAARAGRHGRGFSIVADEVRNLAGRSAKAAQDTAQMLEVTVQKLEKGADLAEYTDGAVREIVQNTTKLAGLFREISKSSGEQSEGINQIADSLAQIDRITQHNTITAHETASAAVALSWQAEALGKMMRTFRLRKDGVSNRPRRKSVGRQKTGSSSQKKLAEPTGTSEVYRRLARTDPVDQGEMPFPSSRISLGDDSTNQPSGKQ